MFKGGHPRFNEHLGTFAVIFPANRGHSGDEKMRDLCQQGSSNYMYSRSSTKINNDILLILRRLCVRCSVTLQDSLELGFIFHLRETTRTIALKKTARMV